MFATRSETRRRPWWVRITLAILISAAATVVRLALDPWLGAQFPFLFFLLAAALSAYLGGWWAGVTTVVLCAGASMFFLLEPLHDFRVASTPDRIGLGLFVLVALGACAIIEKLHDARREALRS